MYCRLRLFWFQIHHIECFTRFRRLYSLCYVLMTSIALFLFRLRTQRGNAKTEENAISELWAHTDISIASQWKYLLDGEKDSENWKEKKRRCYQSINTQMQEAHTTSNIHQPWNPKIRRWNSNRRCTNDFIEIWFFLLRLRYFQFELFDSFASPTCLLIIS